MGVGEQGISLLWCALIRKSMFSSGVNGFIFPIQDYQCAFITI